MRQIGRIADEIQMERFIDYLLTVGIHASGETDGNQWAIWVKEEDRLDFARDSLRHFQSDPDHPRYLDHKQRAEDIRMAERSKSDRALENMRRGGDLWGSGMGPTARKAPITVTLIALSILVSLATNFGSNESSELFGFVRHEHYDQNPQWDHSDRGHSLTDIRAGEVWRLVTPIFLHLGVFHLVFNMLWLHQIGTQIEAKKGPAVYLVLILALAVFSCLVQALVWRYPFFGGMSGVVYGIFGYVWMRIRYSPRDGFVLGPNTVPILLIWFVICLASEGIANGGHTGGLVLGVAIGYLTKQGWSKP